jgi:hypothetical protein
VANAGQLARTGGGTGISSWSLTKTLIITDLDELIGDAMERYGLTCAEAAAILAECTQQYARYAVRDQQKRSKARSGAIGTPREDK